MAYIESVIVQSYDPAINFDPISSINNKRPDNNRLVIYNNPGKLSEEVILSFAIDQPDDVEVSVYTLQGQLIDKEILSNRSSGEQTHTIAANMFQSTGNYLVVLKSKSGISTGRLIRY